MNHVGLHLAKAQRMGKPLEIAIACQCDPADSHGRGDRHSLWPG